MRSVVSVVLQVDRLRAVEDDPQQMLLADGDDEFTLEELDSEDDDD